MIKIIGFDLDDTLLGSNKDIPDLESVKKAINKGIKIAFCSGRPFSKKTKEYYQELGINEGYFCGYNGTAIFDIKTEECIYENSLDTNELFFIMDVVNKAFNKIKDDIDISDVSICYHHDGIVYTNRINKFIELEAVLNKTKAIVKDNLIDDNTIANKFMIDGEPEVISALLPYVKAPLEERFNVMVSMPCFIEVIKKDASKYSGLKTIADIYGISENEIMAFGDSMNDYELVKDAYLGIAMGNSVQRIKEVSKYVTDTNDNHGIKKALEKFGVI